MTKRPDNSGRNQDGTFAKGCSGNPAGKPRGSRHKATQAVEAMLDGEAEALTRKAIELALGGDTTALRLCFERLLPPRKGRAVRFDLPESLTGGEMINQASLGLLRAVSEGRLAAEEAVAVTPLLEGARRALETEELEVRIAALERRRK